MPVCITHVLDENGLAGAGAHTWPAVQLPSGVDVGAHARATCPQTGGIVVAIPPVAAHMPPAATGAATVTLWAIVVGWQPDVTVCVPAAVWQELSKKNVITGPSHDSPVTAPHEHMEHVAGGAVSIALPSNTGVAAKPAPQEGGAPGATGAT